MTVPDWLRRPPAIAALILVAIVVLHAAPLGALDFYGDDHVLDALHVVGFAALTVWLVSQLRRGLPEPFCRGAWPFLAAAAAAVAIAFVAEGAQVLTSRDASYGDLFRDLTGTTAALLYTFSATRRWPLRAALVIGAAAALVSGLRQPYTELTAKLATLRRLPVIADFEDDSQLRMFRRLGVLLDTTAAPEGFAPGRVARIRQRGERRFHGIRIEQPVPDWSGFDALSFTVATIGPESSELRVRIHDETYAGEPGDRFVRSTPIGPEPATVRITLEEIRNAPANRPMDLTDIDRVLFDMPAAEFVDFYIDDLRFE